MPHLDMADPNLLAWTCSRCGATGEVIVTTDLPKGDGTYARWYPILKATEALERHGDRCPRRPDGDRRHPVVTSAPDGQR